MPQGQRDAQFLWTYLLFFLQVQWHLVATPALITEVECVDWNGLSPSVVRQGWKNTFMSLTEQARCSICCFPGTQP